MILANCGLGGCPQIPFPVRLLIIMLALIFLMSFGALCVRDWWRK